MFYIFTAAVSKLETAAAGKSVPGTNSPSRSVRCGWLRAPKSGAFAAPVVEQKVLLTLRKDQAARSFRQTSAVEKEIRLGDQGNLSIQNW